MAGGKREMSMTIFSPPHHENIKIERLDHAPEIFVDGYWGVAELNGVLRFNLFADREPAAAGHPVRRVIVARLALSTNNFPTVLTALNELARSLENSGLIPREQAEGEAPPSADSLKNDA